MQLMKMRKSLDMTQLELATRLEIGYSTYSRNENLQNKGGTVPSWLVYAVAWLAIQHERKAPAAPSTAAVDGKSAARLAAEADYQAKYGHLPEGE